MRNSPLQDAAEKEAAKWLYNSCNVGNRIIEDAAKLVAPLLGELVRQSLLQELSEPKEDARLVGIKEAVEKALGWWQEQGRQADRYDDYPEGIFANLAEAVKYLPTNMPAPVTVALPDAVNCATLRHAVYAAYVHLQRLLAEDDTTFEEDCHILGILQRAVEDFPHA